MELVTDWVGDRVRLPGYVVPLDFEGTRVTGFLLVPYMGACIHVPPPPPNQIVYVRTKEPIEIDEIFEAVYATGTFEADLIVDRARPGRLPDHRRDGGALRAVLRRAMTERRYSLEALVLLCSWGP